MVSVDVTPHVPNSCLQGKSLVVIGVAVGHVHVVASPKEGSNAVRCFPLSGLLGHRSRLVLVPAWSYGSYVRLVLVPA